ncbi:putative ribonuclease H-like domain-containing protein [Tanacetum coccineum]
MGRITGQREVRPVWNNAQRVNHQNKLAHPHPKRNFVPTAVLTKSGNVLVNTAKQSSSRAAVSNSTARYVNIVASRPTMNGAKPCSNVFHKSHSSVKRTIYQRTTPKNTVVSAVQGHEENAVKSSACWIWRPTGKVIDHISKDSGSYMPKRFDYGNPQYALQDQGIFDSGCSRHMTGNKSYLTDYQDIDRGFVAFAGSPKGGKFEGKAGEGFLVGYSVNSKAFRVFNTRTKKVEENLHIKFLKNKPNVAGSGPEWLFDIDSLTKSMNYEPITQKASNENKFCYHFLTSDIQGPKISDDELLSMLDKKNDAYKVNDGAEADLTNLDTIILVSPTPTTRIHKDHPLDQVIREVHSVTQTRRMSKNLEEHGLVARMQEGIKHKDYQNYRFACFLSQIEPKKVIQALADPSWIETIQEELLQFKLQKVYRNKKDERGIVDRNKARLVAQGHTQEEGIDYDEVFAPVARIEAIRLFFAYASYMDFVVYEMVVKSEFLYDTIEEEIYVCQPLGFEDPEFLDKVYKIEKDLYGLHQAPRAWYETLSTYLLENGFIRGIIDKTLFIKKDKGDILLVQVYVDDIIFGSTKKSLCVEFESLMHKKFQMSSIGELTFFLGLQTSSTPIETHKALLKDEEAEDVDVHLYRSMIGSLMYLTASRPDIMFAVCACARFQVTPKVSHLHAVKRIFRYLKGQPKLGLWYPRDSPFDLEAFSDSDYAGASLDRKSTTGGCQFLGKRLISWQCKKQTIVANSTTEAEYVAAVNFYG